MKIRRRPRARVASVARCTVDSLSTKPDIRRSSVAAPRRERIHQAERHTTSSAAGVRSWLSNPSVASSGDVHRPQPRQ
ncbi:MAG: hypothetical protein U0791_16075 [Gemmataceae bacterium]